jgi:hypothetical protein
VNTVLNVIGNMQYRLRLKNPLVISPLVASHRGHHLG